MPIDPLIGSGSVRSRRERISTREALRWHDSGFVFETADWRSEETELEWAADYHLFILTNYGSTRVTQVRGAGQLAFEGRDKPGALSFVPAGVDRRCSYKSADLNYSALWLKPDLLKEWYLPLPPDRLTINGHDPVIAAIMVALRDETLSGEIPDLAYVEQAARMMMHRLSRLDRQSRPDAGRLSRRVLSAVDDYIRSHIGRNISLSDLSLVTGIPVDTFARRFKATTGYTPYAWILEMRVRCLTERLCEKNVDLGHLSMELGFSSQSHMTNTFRRIRGVTPSRYRRQFLSDS
ncbi:helix-turn-helix domain-containing protein [Rhizobium sullae]|uniref:AraC family transcriptional regulator n=1 Tax=Rhizobium sullae TaxID=50338 RepID=A0A4R3PZ86_RHISU|nr:AraC family transcriptional regulator [Rhizobium sullae]TCU11142.1 AraC family transcriptional regulator [Rhizobium sullae]